MAAPSPRTWLTGDVVTATLLNTEVRDALKFVLGQGTNPKPLCSVYRSSEQTVSNNSVTAIAWNAELEDSTGTMHSTSSNSSRITAPINGLYMVIWSLVWATDATGNRYSTVELNASGTHTTAKMKAIAYETAMSGSRTVCNGSVMIRMAAGDHLELFGWHDSGASLAVDTASNMIVEWRGE